MLEGPNLRDVEGLDSVETPEGIRVGNFRVDTRSGELFDASGGAVDRLTPRRLGVLTCLARHAGEIVEKETFFEEVWGGRAVTDDVLTVAVSQLRKAFGDSARRPRYIQTVPTRGYRLVAGVAWDRPGVPAPAQDPAVSGRHRRWRGLGWLAAAGLAAGLGWTWAAALRAPETAAPTDPGDMSQTARESYLRGSYLLAQGCCNPLRAAIAEFEAAIREEPGFADAYVALAQAELELSGSYEESVRPASAHLDRALELDPESAAAHHLEARIDFLHEWDWAAAERELAAAIRLEPDHAEFHATYAQLLIALGRTPESIEEIEIARRLDPVSTDLTPNISQCYAIAGRLDEAIALIERGLQLEADWKFGDIYLVSLYQLRGQRERAAHHALLDMERRRANPGLVSIVAAEQDPAVALERFWRWRLEAIDALSEERYVSPAYRAFPLVQLGRHDEAIRALWLGFEQRSGAMIPVLGVHPFFDPLRGDPRFRELVARLRLPQS